MRFFDLAVLSLVLLEKGSHAAQVSDWSYFGENGPNNWPGICTMGKKQSPINIVTDDTIKTDLGQLRFIRYDFAFSGTVINTGHGIQITLTGVPIHLKGGNLPSTYVLEQMHFHWNAEHTVDGIRYPLELHLVHYDEQYKSIAAATEYENGIAVVAVLFELDKKDNRDLEAILNATEAVSAWIGGSSAAEIQSKVVPSLLLPKDHSTYYRYEGSLTTPQCQESVIWSVLDEKLTISTSQLKILKNVKMNNAISTHNYRPIQRLGTRNVYLHLDGYSSASSLISNFLFVALLNVILVRHDFTF